MSTDVETLSRGWATIRLVEIAKFTSGAPIRGADLRSRSSDYPYPVFGGNGISGYIDEPLLIMPTVILGRVGQKCGAVYLSDGPAWITDNALYPRHVDSSIDIRFLALILENARLGELRNRNDLPLITQGILESVRLIWPPLHEQRAITSARSDVDGLFDALEALIAKKRAIKQGILQQLLTGRVRLV